MTSPTVSARSLGSTVLLSAYNPKSGSIYSIGQTNDPAACPFGHLVYVTVGSWTRCYELSHFDAFDGDNPGYRVAMSDGGILVIRQDNASLRSPGYKPTELELVQIEDLDIGADNGDVKVTMKLAHVPRQLRDTLRQWFAELLAIVPGETGDEAWDGVGVDAMSSVLDQLNIAMVTLKAAAASEAYDKGLQVRAFHLTAAALALRRYAARRNDGTADHWTDLRHLALPVLDSVTVLLSSMWASPQPA